MNTWNINLQGRGPDIITAVTAVPHLPAALLAVITDFCNQATGKVLLNTAGSYAQGYSLSISQGAARVGAGT
jgi:hypothetical protein